MTNTWQDIKNANVVVEMGGNAGDAHPCGFKWVIEAKIENKAKLVVIDPRFTRSASVADLYAPIRPGTDIAFLNGVIRYLLEKDRIQHDYVRAYTNASLIVKEGFAFEDGLFTGYKEDTHSYDKSTWDYELDDQGYAKIDDTWQHPRCVMSLLRKHVDRYTPEMVSRICGTPQDKYLQVCDLFASTAAPDKAMTSLFALGWTQHSVGSQNIRTMAMVQMLLGNIGVAGGGMNALRGHSNIQGLTDIGLLSNQIPGYLTLPSDSEPTFEDYMKTRQFKPLRPGQTSYWQNYRKFIVSFQKAIYGDAARADNDWAYDWLPKLDIPLYDIIKAFEMMANGEMNGYICQGFNPLQAFPDRGKIRKALGKLKFLVVIDPLDTETSRFWENFGPQNPSDPASIQTEVFQLPTTCFAEENGSLVNSARWLQWHWKAADPPGEAQTDIWIMSGIFHRMREMYRKDGGAFPDPILNLTWNYTNPVPTRPGRTGEGHERPGAGGYQGRDGSGHASRGPIARWLRPVARRRHDDVRLLDLLGLLYREGQPDGPPRRHRSTRAGHRAELGLGLAGEPADSLQSRQRQCRRQRLEPSQANHRMERHGVGRDRCARLWTDHEAVRRGRSVHHERRGRRATVRSRPDGGRPVPRALRTVRIAVPERPASEGPHQPGGASVRR